MNIQVHPNIQAMFSASVISVMGDGAKIMCSALIVGYMANR
jgi:hypothetical protein